MAYKYKKKKRKIISKTVQILSTQKIFSLLCPLFYFVVFSLLKPPLNFLQPPQSTFSLFKPLLIFIIKAEFPQNIKRRNLWLLFTEKKEKNGCSWRNWHEQASKSTEKQKVSNYNWFWCFDFIFELKWNLILLIFVLFQKNEDAERKKGNVCNLISDFEHATVLLLKYLFNSVIFSIFLYNVQIISL